jgi:hypothetical protein
LRASASAAHTVPRSRPASTTTTGSAQPASEAGTPSSVLACAPPGADGAAFRELGGLPHPPAAATAMVAIARSDSAARRVPAVANIPVEPARRIVSIMRRFRSAIQCFAMRPIRAARTHTATPNEPWRYNVAR